MYDSPQIDMGYDISDYENVYPPYGTVEDMDSLIKQIHDRGMRIVLDLVINHTSDQHAWFKESRSSKDNPKRDWYIWRPAKMENGKRLPPNNWRSNFSQPAWTWDEHTQEYYLNLFCTEQPDLNWENPTTRQAIYDSAMRFWLNKGVDGFRVDTVNMYSKGDLADVEITDPKRYDQPAGHKYCNGPRMHEFLREMHAEVLSKYGDVMTVGELPNTKTTDHVLRYVGSGDPQLSMVFQFDIVDLGTGGLAGKPKFEYTPFKLTQFKDLWTRLQSFTAGTDGWATAFAENHDQGRSTSRYGNDSPEFWARSAKLLATLLATSTGTLFVYQGQEIGMINGPDSWKLDEYIDVDSRNYIEFIKERTNNDPAALEHVRSSLQTLARDHARLPMQWDDSNEHAGFSTKKPWMRTHDAYKEINAAKQEKDPKSVLNYWRKMLKLRKEYNELLVYGEVEAIDADSEETFVFVKKAADGKQRAVVALNFTKTDQSWNAPEWAKDGKASSLVGNYDDMPGAEEKLRPWEARVYVTK